jgi:hypothetical protein
MQIRGKWRDLLVPNTSQGTDGLDLGSFIEWLGQDRKESRVLYWVTIWQDRKESRVLCWMTRTGQERVQVPFQGDWKRIRKNFEQLLSDWEGSVKDCKALNTKDSPLIFSYRMYPKNMFHLNNQLHGNDVTNCIWQFLLRFYSRRAVHLLLDIYIVIQKDSAPIQSIQRNTNAAYKQPLLWATQFSF